MSGRQIPTRRPARPPAAGITNVLLADHLDGQLPTAEHRAPLRLAAPRHHGHKSIKHLARIELWRDAMPGLAGWKKRQGAGDEPPAAPA